jgi:hypothetical protein
VATVVLQPGNNSEAVQKVEEADEVEERKRERERDLNH